jgi:hypothetical protein
MEVAEETGWRRASIASLLCNQFARTNPDSESLSFGVTPSVQKLGYDYGYSISEQLRLKIVSFILTTRQDFLEEMNWMQRAAAHLFISAKDGQALTPQRLSVIFGRAFRAAGAPTGAGLHSLRRRFVEKKIEEELRLRLRLGLDTSAASISASVSVSLGHKNPESLTSYVNRAQSEILKYSVGTAHVGGRRAKRPRGTE